MRLDELRQQRLRMVERVRERGAVALGVARRRRALAALAQLDPVEAHAARP